MEPILMMLPPALVIVRATAWLIRKVPRRFTARMRSKSSTEVSRNGLLAPMPAQFTSTSMRSNNLDQPTDAPNIADIELVAMKPRRGGECQAPCGAGEIGGDGFGTLGGETLGNGGADAAGAAGDDGDLFLELHAAILAGKCRARKGRLYLRERS